MLRRLLSSLAALWCGVSVQAAPTTLEAPNISAVPANQLVVAGNACGPAALLNAFRFGNRDWQRAANALGGSSDRARILEIIREIGMRPSKHVPGHPRWSRRGVGVADLRDMANEMTLGQYLPFVSDEAFFLVARESPEQLLRRVYQRLNTSLVKGLPPVLSLRRFALRRQPGKAAPQWVVVDAHFVTLTVLPRKLDRGTRAIAVSYLDPWGGRRCQGNIRIPAHPALVDAAGNSTCLEADFPQSPVGKTRVGHGEESILVPSAAIGRW
jgi:hypothetical protein